MPSTLKEQEMGSLSSAYKQDSLICDISRLRNKPVRDPESQDRRHAEEPGNARLLSAFSYHVVPGEELMLFSKSSFKALLFFG